MKAVVETSDMRGDSAPAGWSGLPKAVVRLGWVSLLTDVSSEMIVPLLPAFLTTLSGVPATALGWIEGVADATASFVKILSGRWADRAKAKKPLVLLGYGLSSVARPLIGLAPSWPTVVLIRFFDRIGKGVRTAPRDTMIAAAAPPNRRGAAFGLHRGFDNAGAVFGPLLAAGLVGWLGLSLRSGLPAGGHSRGTVSSRAGVRGERRAREDFFEGEQGGEPDRASSDTGSSAPGPTPFEEKPPSPLPRRNRKRSGPSQSSPGLLAHRGRLRASSRSPPRRTRSSSSRRRRSGSPPAGFPSSGRSRTGSSPLFSTWGGGLSDRYGRRRLLVAAWGLYAACYAGFAFVSSAGPLVALVGVYSLYYALSEGTERALVADLVPPASRGRAFGWMNGLIGFAALPASVGFGLIWEHAGSKTAFLAGAAIAGIAVAVLLVLRFPRPRRAG